MIHATLYFISFWNTRGELERGIFHNSEHEPLKETIGLDPGRGASPDRL